MGCGNCRSHYIYIILDTAQWKGQGYTAYPGNDIVQSVTTAGLLRTVILILKLLEVTVQGYMFTVLSSVFEKTQQIWSDVLDEHSNETKHASQAAAVPAQYSAANTSKSRLVGLIMR